MDAHSLTVYDVLPEVEFFLEHQSPDVNGLIYATFEIIALTGWAPDESQPKPLRPGSAAQRLADALGAAEFRLPPGDRTG